MKTKNLALRLSGTIFGLVAIMHLLRIALEVPVNIGGWELPLWINWIGLIATAFLCGWLWSLSIRRDAI